MDKMYKIINNLTEKCDNVDKHVLMGYCTVASYIIINSQLLKEEIKNYQ